MVRKAIVIGLTVFSVPLIAQNGASNNETEKPYYFEKEWQEKNAPHGFMIGSDGKVLIEIGEADGGSEYGMLLDDYVKRDPNYPQVWIYGFHKKDKAVAYRTSKQRISVSCQYQTITTTFLIGFTADGRTLFTNNYSEKSIPVVPGSLGEQWYEYACRPK